MWALIIPVVLYLFMNMVCANLNCLSLIAILDEMDHTYIYNSTIAVDYYGTVRQIAVDLETDDVYVCFWSSLIQMVSACCCQMKP